MKKKEYTELNTCIDCGIEKPLSSFWRKGTPRKDGTYGYRAFCKECGSARSTHEYHNEGGKEKQKGRSFKYNLKKYGLTPAAYQEIHDNQEGSCAICSSPVALRLKTSHKLFVDHDHKTGKVRGLLCHNRNAGLGHFRDNEQFLRNAIGYLNETIS